MNFDVPGGRPPPEPRWAPPPGADPGFGPAGPVPGGRGQPPAPGWGAPPPPRRSPRVSGMAIIALVAAVAGLFVPVLLTVAALVLAILSARAIRRSGGALTGRGLAITAGITAVAVLAVNALTIVLVVRSWPQISRGFDQAGDAFSVARGLAEGRVTEWPALAEGHCYVLPFPEDETLVERVDCDTPHDGEVYASVLLDYDAYPGEIQISTDAARLCGQRLQGAVDPDRSGEELNDVTMWPDELKWDNGVDYAICAVAPARAGRKLTGSVRAGG